MPKHYNRFFKALAVFVLSVSFSFTVVASEPAVDSIAAVTDTVVPDAGNNSSTRWVKQLIDNGFHINDPSIEYPRFPRFCLKVYNWGDKVFNGYDSTYVVSTGHNWKVLGKTYNWFENYALIFDRHKMLRIRSDMYADIGGYLCFMAVSVGYMFNANELIADRNDTRSNFNLNFTCSRFTVDYTATWTRGGAHISRFGNYDSGKRLDIPFESMSNKTKSLSAMYFFNNRRYSHAAAYCFSKYQLKSAGSWIAGFNYLQQNVSMDFRTLPIEILQSLPESEALYNFHYRDYSALGGYAYNWALSPRKWLVNATGVLGLGYKQTSEDNTDGRRSMVASNAMISAAAVYNHRSLFLGAQARFNVYFYFNSNYTFLNAMSSLQIVVGARF